jgi:hypothetical protein
MKISFGLILAILFLTNCANTTHRYPTKVNRLLGTNANLSTTALSNEGTLCAYKPSSNILVLKYYPLSKSCASSSAYSWKLNGIDIKNENQKIVVNSYSIYKKNNSPIATADCAGAGVRVKRVTTQTPNTLLYWGDAKLATISPNRDMQCFKKLGGKYIHTKPLD